MMKEISLFDTPAHILKDSTVLDFIKNVITKNNVKDNDIPFFVLDIGDIVQKIKFWKNKLPRVKPFYAIKSNDNQYVLEILNALGTGFDCASKAEFRKVLSMDVDPSRIIYAHPCKPVSHIRASKANGVDLMTFDSKSELEKVKEVFPNASLVLRIRCDALDVQCNLGIKFGVQPELSVELLQYAKDLSLNVVGVAFHVGSGCREPEAFLRAIRTAKWVFEEAKILGFNFHLLDIGGGYPGSDLEAFEEMANLINVGLEENFPNPDEVEVIAEPGRYISTSAFTLVTKIVSKKSDNVSSYSYILNDGVYGSFNCIFFDHKEVQPYVIKEIGPNKPYFNSTIWGPTCDGIDKIVDKIPLPELNTGDCLYWTDMGAYTSVAASPFNGFPSPDVHIVMPEHTWLYLKENALIYEGGSFGEYH